jgi:hypothetical protein
MITKDLFTDIQNAPTEDVFMFRPFQMKTGLKQLAKKHAWEGDPIIYSAPIGQRQAIKYGFVRLAIVLERHLRPTDPLGGCSTSRNAQLTVRVAAWCDNVSLREWCEPHRDLNPFGRVIAKDGDAGMAGRHGLRSGRRTS